MHLSWQAAFTGTTVEPIYIWAMSRAPLNISSDGMTFDLPDDGPLLAGPAIAGGMLFVNSGYARAGGMPGNVLLAFSVDGK